MVVDEKLVQCRAHPRVSVCVCVRPVCSLCCASCKAEPPNPKTPEEHRIMAKAATACIFEGLSSSLLVPHGQALKENTNLQSLVAGLRACFSMMHLHFFAQLVSYGLAGVGGRG